MEKKIKTLYSVERLRDSYRDADARNEFESDFGRVIFSPAIRRMHDKTQVFPLTTDDNIHSRLTHSMEVMAVGHSLGVKLIMKKEFADLENLAEYDLIREIPIILKSACLVHDIGNPPFGHFGEAVVQQYFDKLFIDDEKRVAKEVKEGEKGEIRFKLTKLEKEDFTSFDGNAQGFRVLTKLQVLDDAYGLNLTFATLGAYLKYPNTGEIDKSQKIIARKKRGVYQSEKAYLESIFKKSNLVSGNEFFRHPLAFLVEAADSICYYIMDMEDGFNKGIYNYKFIKKQFKVVDGIEEIFKKIEAKDKLTNKKPSDRKKVVNFRIQLISRLVDTALDNYIKNYSSIKDGSYQEELIFDDETKLADTLSLFSVNNIFPIYEIQSLELTGHSVLSGLLDFYIEFIFSGNKHYIKRAVGMISNSIIKIALLENNFDAENENEYYKYFLKPVIPENDGGSKTEKKLNDYSKLRIIVDFIAGMTDQYALNHYQKLSGQKIS
jgi:dGTPase